MALLRRDFSVVKSDAPEGGRQEKFTRRQQGEVKFGFT